MTSLASSPAATSALILRPGTPADAHCCGTICYEAFKSISERHNFPPDFPAPEIATELITLCLHHPKIYSVVAEMDGRIVGSNYLWENATIAGIGPITVDPGVQNSAIGKRMMQHVLQRVAECRFPGVRLVQAGYHMRSLSLYTKLGFDVREPLACMLGESPKCTIPGRSVRPVAERDLVACNELCSRVHGFDRADELQWALSTGSPLLAEHDGRITGYATMFHLFGHAVGETNDDLKALIGGAKEIASPGFLLPMRNAELFRWCLEHGLRVIQPMNLMTLGLYNEPRGAFLPSVLY